MTPERMRQYGRGLGLWQDKALAVGEPISCLRGDDHGSVTHPPPQARVTSSYHMTLNESVL